LKSRRRKNIRLHLVSVGEAIHLIEKAHDGQHFSQTFGIESQPLHGGRV